MQQSTPMQQSVQARIDLGSINNAFPNSQFPTGAIHEFCSDSQEGANASIGFLSGILGRLMAADGTCVWASASQSIFPPALAAFDVPTEKIIFLHLKKEKELLWAIEEALKCNTLAAVVGEVTGLDFKVSRRLQLATEQSHVTGFILRRNMLGSNTTACAARWRITPIPSLTENGLPGLGFPRWNVELLKVRNGKTGTWQMEWANGIFREVVPAVQEQFSIIHKMVG